MTQLTTPPGKELSGCRSRIVGALVTRYGLSERAVGFFRSYAEPAAAAVTGVMMAAAQTGQSRNLPGCCRAEGRTPGYSRFI